MAQLPLPLTDESPMPFGKYKGKKMADVPDYYLLYIYDNYDLQPHVKTYIEQNLAAIKTNIKRSEEKRNAKR